MSHTDSLSLTFLASSSPAASLYIDTETEDDQEKRTAIAAASVFSPDLSSASSDTPSSPFDLDSIEITFFHNDIDPFSENSLFKEMLSISPPSPFFTSEEEESPALEKTPVSPSLALEDASVYEAHSLSKPDKLQNISKTTPCLDTPKTPQITQSLIRYTIKETLWKYSYPILQAFVNQGVSSSSPFKRLNAEVALEILNERSPIIKQNSDEKKQLLTSFLRNYHQSTLQTLIHRKYSSSLACTQTHADIAQDILTERARFAKPNTYTVKCWIEECLQKHNPSTVQALIKQGLNSPSELSRLNAEIAQEMLDSICKQDQQPHEVSKEEASSSCSRKRKMDSEQEDEAKRRKV